MAQTDLMLHSTLAPEVETDVVAAQGDMAVAQSSQAVGFVLPGILLITHSHTGLVEQQDDGGNHPLPAQLAGSEPLIQLAAQA